MEFLFFAIFISGIIAIAVAIGGLLFMNATAEVALTVGVVFFFISLFALYIRKGKSEGCPQCGKSFAMVEIKRTKKFEFASKKTVQKEIKNKNGDVIGYVDQTEPTTVYIYDCTDECKHCGYQRQIERREEY